MRVAIFAVVAMSAQVPQFDASNPEGLVETPGGRVRYVWLRKGHWSETPVNAPPAILATFTTLTNIMKATPTGGNPVGWWMNASRNYEPRTGAANIGYFPFYIEDVLSNGKWTQATAGETESVYFWFNELPSPLDRPIITREGETELYLRPRHTSTFRGLPIYEEQELIVAHKDPWTTVTVARALKSALKEFEKDRANAEKYLAGKRKTNDEVQSPAYEAQMKAQLDKVYGPLRTTNPRKWETAQANLPKNLAHDRDKTAREANPQRGDKDGAWYWDSIDAYAEAAAQLASLTADDGAKPACFEPDTQRRYRYAIKGAIKAAPAANCDEIVTTNSKFFDPAKPRTTPQILRVRFFGRCAKVVNGEIVTQYKHTRQSHPQGCAIHRPIWNEMDWSKVAALVPR